MAEREIVNAVCHGQEFHWLSFTTGASSIDSELICQHNITYNGIDYVVRMLRSTQMDKGEVNVYFFDNIETLIKILSRVNCLDPIVFVLVTKESGSDSSLVLQKYVRILQHVDVLLEALTFLEWRIGKTRHTKDLTFRETVLQSILKCLDVKYKSVILFGSYSLYNYMRKNINTSFPDDNVVLDEIFFALSYNRLWRSCTWWSTPSSPNKTSTKPPIKIKVSDDAKTLHAGIDHDDGDLHSLYFHEQDCSDIVDIINSLTYKNACIKRLRISNCKGTLSLRFLAYILEGLEYLTILESDLDLQGLAITPEVVSSLRVLDLKGCRAKEDEVPAVIGNLQNLKYLDLTGTCFTALPESFSNLDHLEHLLLNTIQMVFPPSTILNLPVKDVVQYLKQHRQPKAENREAKVMVVGQEGVGKSTLVKSSKRRYPLGKTNPPVKTDGIEISALKVNSTEIKVYDLAGDVDYHNTHTLFFSPNCLHLAVFDLSNIPINKDSRSTDQFCRLELWLQTIASQDPNSYVIIVGTHLDHYMLTPQMLTRIRTTVFDILQKYRCQHATGKRLTKHDECIVCNPEKLSMQGSTLGGTTLDVAYGQSDSPCSSIPHILGYHEVSGITNKNIKGLKQSIDATINDIKRYTKTDIIPRRWLHFRQKMLAQLSDEGDLKKQPIATLAYVQQRAAKEVEIYTKKSFVAMLRFFHSQGDFLWYEDIPEMKDVVILDPQWLSNQLRTLISHLPSVDAICEGFLHHSHLPKIWSDMSEENRSRLMTVYRSVGLCISVTDDVDMFPCKLPIGWPDSEMWPPIPKSDEKQTSLLFEFSFVPASFFSDLIVAINKRKDSFPSNVNPIYYRFNAVYIIKRQGQCHRHREGELDYPALATAACSEADDSLYHRIHMEITPHTNSLKVTIRGLQPCCQVPDIRSMIETVRSQRYPGITFEERIICPECELKRLPKPSTFDFHESTTGPFCSTGHKVGSKDEVLVGKVNTSDVVASTVVQTGRVMGETLADHFCPKLFVVLPINLDSLSFKDRFVYSLIRDGYAVHLLCESPDQWHFLSSPGFRVGKPNEFFKKYGGRVSKLLRVISALGTPFKIAAAVEPHCKAGAAAASAAHNINKEMKSLLDDYLEKYPHLKPSLGSPDDDLKDLKSSRGLQRSELSRFLEVAAPGQNFGPLICTYVDKYNEWLWLCEVHCQQYEIVQR